MAVDDEPWALALISDYIKKVPFFQLACSTDNAIEGLQLLQVGGIDLVFLDIQMPEISGMQFLKIINNKVRVILTTAYSEYALEGYEHNVVDYLLKPVSFDRFYAAALKAQSLFLPGQPVVPTVAYTAPAAEDFIFVKTDNRIVKVWLSEILLIEGLRDYIAIHTTNEKLIALDSLKMMEEGLPNPRFVRVHKSFIVAPGKIDSIERNRIFIGNQVVPIGETYRDYFFSLLKGKQFG